MSNQMTEQAVIVAQSSLDPAMGLKRLALFSSDGTAVNLSGTAPTGAAVLLTGFTATTADSVAPADTVNQAIAKLEARILELENA